MRRALYRKYRPRNLQEVIDQKHITETLLRALKQERISHAYLLTGPRGVGKTSIARILAYEVNKLPYDEDQTHMDIIEIDAASNRRIDEIRDLRDKVHVAPALVKYRVYIIDEVHMLTKEAFNALLKTLEEPPSHAIFILATTDVHKVPDTIISRCIRFHFKSIDEDDMVGHLKSISKTEKIQISEDALHLIAKQSGGSFRDSISLLDQCAAIADNINVSDVEQLLGIIPEQSLRRLYLGIASAEPKNILESIQELIDQGIPVSNIAKQLASIIRDNLAIDNEISMVDKVKLLEKLIEVPSSSDSRAALEIAVLSLPIEVSLVKAHEAQSTKIEENHSKGVYSSSRPTHPFVKASDNNDTSPKHSKETGTKKKINIESKDVSNNANHKTKKSTIHNEETWGQLLSLVRKKHNTLYSILRMASVVVDDDTLRLTFAFVFHQKLLGESKNKKILSKIVSEVYQTPLDIEYLVDPDLKTTQLTAKNSVPIGNTKMEESNGPIKNISNIFGGGEMLE